jgi:benzoylformate decarboxylase
MFGFQSRPILGKGDVNLVCGTYIVPEVFPDLDDVFAPESKVVHIDLNGYEIAKNHPVDVGFISDPKLTLARLAALLEGVMTPEQKTAAQSRAEQIGSAKIAKIEAAKAQDLTLKDASPMYFATFVAELAKHLPEDAIIFDEALTNSPPISRYFPITEPDRYFLTRGGSLGVGIPGAIGVKLANPDKTVIGFTGDGGAMYTIQALWSAARHNVAAKFVVCNNRSYRILQYNIQQYWKELEVPARDLPLSFDLSKPEIRFDEIARSMGVAAVRVERPEEIAPAIQQALAHDGPFLIDVLLEGNVKPDLIGVRCGQ